MREEILRRREPFRALDETPVHRRLYVTRRGRVVHAAHQLVPQREPNSTHADDSATRGHGDRDCTAASQVSSNSGQSTCPGVRAHRHIPLTDRCSSCLFPETDYAPTQCATAEVAVGPDSGRIDAALPFLSFAAGAMAAAEILKLGLPGYPFAPNRVVLTRNQPHELCGPPSRCTRTASASGGVPRCIDR
jgi:hypothetical protein